MGQMGDVRRTAVCKSFSSLSHRPALPGRRDIAKFASLRVLRWSYSADFLSLTRVNERGRAFAKRIIPGDDVFVRRTPPMIQVSSMGVSKMSVVDLRRR
jgi:hypothetical protein